MRTGGFSLRVGIVRLSSHSSVNAFIISLAAAFALAALSLRHDVRRALKDDLLRARRWFESTNSWRGRWPVLHNALAVMPIAIAVAGIGLDIRQWLAGVPLWVDEEMIALNLRDRAITQLGGQLWLGQSAPFGWLVLERGAIVAIGMGERTLRAVPLFFGIGMLLLALWIGRRWMSPIGATVLMLLSWIGQWLAHYRFEVKHYTADAFFGLLIPFLAAWTLEARIPADRSARVRLWWVTVAVALWCANGALFATPACAVILFVALWRTDGRRAAVAFSATGLVWLASFSLHYAISLRYTHENPYLQSTWSQDLFPSAVSLTAGARWFMDRFEPLAGNPAGTIYWGTLWLSALAGILSVAGSPIGWFLAAVPLSAFALAGFVPLHERFAIWIVPALYAGVALFVDRLMAIVMDGLSHRRRWLVALAAVLVLALEFPLCADIVMRGKTSFDVRRRETDKQQLDDRAADRWLM